MRVVILHEAFRGKGGRAKQTLAIAEYLSRNHEVRIASTGLPDLSAASAYFGIDLSRIKTVELTEPWLASRLPLPPRWASLIIQLFHRRQLKKLSPDLFVSNHNIYLKAVGRASILICNFPASGPVSQGRNMVLRRAYNNLTRWAEETLLGSQAERIQSYSLITTISEFSASWIRRRWKVEALVWSPICEDMGPPASAKAPLILSVGRFVADSGHDNHKAHEYLIDVFKKLERPGWKLCLAGGTRSNARPTEQAADDAYLEGVVRQAQQAGVLVETDPTFDQLRELYRSASLFWQATGFGTDASTEPERQEHFGIATVEAMSAGVVPINYASGGSLEILEKGGGHLWRNSEELVNISRRLIDEPEEAARISGEAVRRARDFSRARFESRLDELIEMATSSTGGVTMRRTRPRRSARSQPAEARSGDGGS